MIGGLTYGLLFDFLSVSGMIINSIILVYFIFRFYILSRAKRVAEELSMTLGGLLNFRITDKSTGIRVCDCGGCKENQ